MTQSTASYSHSSSFGGQTRSGNRGPRAMLSNGLIGDDDVRDSREIFARNLKFWLQKREMKGAELSRRLGKNPAVVSQWLNCVSGPDILTLGAVAHELGIAVSDLFYDPEAVTKSTAKPPVDEEEKVLKDMAKLLKRPIKVGPKKN